VVEPWEVTRDLARSINRSCSQMARGRTNFWNLVVQILLPLLRWAVGERRTGERRGLEMRVVCDGEAMSGWSRTRGTLKVHSAPTFIS
jgi:hypothetical protein